MDIYKERIRPLFDSSGLQDKEIEALFDLPRGVIYKWGTGNNKSYQKYIPQIASYFHVSTDYLLGNTDDPRTAGQITRGDFMDIYEERILPLFQKSGKSDAELESEMKLPSGILYDWKKKRTKSYKKYCGQISAYFHVSADYLLGNTGDPRPAGQKEKADPQTEIGLDETTKRLIAVAKDGTPEEIDKIIEYAAFLRSQRDKG